MILAVKRDECSAPDDGPLGTVDDAGPLVDIPDRLPAPLLQPGRGDHHRTHLTLNVLNTEHKSAVKKTTESFW